MKGFNTSDGYMGLVEGRYILFASESDFLIFYTYKRDRFFPIPLCSQIFFTIS